MSIMYGWEIGPGVVGTRSEHDEGHKMFGYTFFKICIKYVTPVCMVLVLYGQIKELLLCITPIKIPKKPKDRRLWPPVHSLSKKGRRPFLTKKAGPMELEGLHFPADARLFFETLCLMLFFCSESPETRLRHNAQPGFPIDGTMVFHSKCASFSSKFYRIEEEAPGSPCAQY